MNIDTHYSRSGLKIKARLATRSTCAGVSITDASPIQCDHVQTWADGRKVGFVGSAVNSAVSALAGWICPGVDSMEARKAQYLRFNRETGEIEAAVYPEYAADVLRKIYRLKPAHLEMHTVSL